MTSVTGVTQITATANSNINSLSPAEQLCPGWIPSWNITGQNPTDCDDGPPRNAIFESIDAELSSSGRLVSVKYVSSYFHENEVDVVEYLNNADLRKEQDNHCVPLIFSPLHYSHDISFIVSPLLRKHDDPRFDTVGELMAFVNQAFRGMSFLHAHCNVAYRCPSMEMLMDPEPTFPQMYHPLLTARSRGLNGRAQRVTRTRKPTRYYFSDFGCSERYEPGVKRDAAPPPGVLPALKAPEFQDSDDRHDPFPTDVYYLGNMIRWQLLEKYQGLEFLEPLASQLTQEDPAKRPDMHNAVNSLDNLIHTLSMSTLRSRLIKKDEVGGKILVRFGRTVKHAFRNISYKLHQINPIPTPTYLPAPPSPTPIIPE